jgi:hypothetical protein
VALAAALSNGTIAGTGFDVFSEASIPCGYSVLKAPNTALTPHLGYVTRESYRAYFEGAVEDIKAWRSGAPMRVLGDCAFASIHLRARRLHHLRPLRDLGTNELGEFLGCVADRLCALADEPLS